MPQSKTMQRKIERRKQLEADRHSCTDCIHREGDECTLHSGGGWKAQATKGPCVDWSDT